MRSSDHQWCPSLMIPNIYINWINDELAYRGSFPNMSLIHNSALYQTASSSGIIPHRCDVKEGVRHRFEPGLSSLRALGPGSAGAHHLATYDFRSFSRLRIVTQIRGITLHIQLYLFLVFNCISSRA
jgi:hypothetical protein